MIEPLLVCHWSLRLPRHTHPFQAVSDSAVASCFDSADRAKLIDLKQLTFFAGGNPMLGKVFVRFAQFTPAAVMMRGILEYAFPPERLDELFRQHARQQYEDELLFSTVVDTLALAVSGLRKSVNAAYQASKEKFTVSVTALYD